MYFVNFCFSLQDIDDLLNGKKISSQTSEDVYKKLHVSFAKLTLFSVHLRIEPNVQCFKNSLLGPVV